MTETPAEPFDPAAALAAEGIPLPQEIAIEPAPAPAPAYRYNNLDELLADIAPGSSTEVQIKDLSPELVAILEGIRSPVVPVPATAGGTNPKDALGLAKPDMSVVPPAALLHLASAMMDGARKYGPFNWRDNAVLGRVYVAAAMRHLMQYLDGEDIDPTSGVHHLGHAMACAAILLDARETGNLEDNRPKAGAAGDMIRRWTTDTKFG